MVINMSKDKEIVQEKSNVLKSFATGIIIFFVLALFVWTLDPNMRDHVWQYIKGDTDYVTVSGDNVLNGAQIRQLVEGRGMNFRQYPDALIVQFFKNFSEITELINREVLLKYSRDIGLELSQEAKQMFAIELYKKAKREFELQHNIRYRVPFENFFTYAEDQYLTSIVNSSISQGIIITRTEAELQYKLENNRRQVEFISYDFDNFFKKQQFTNAELKTFYESAEASSSRANLRNKFRALAISGNNKEEMQKFLIKSQSTPGFFEAEAKKRNASAQDFTITPAKRELLQVRSVEVGKYSPVIQQGNQFTIFKMVKLYPREFETLTQDDIKNIREEYSRSPSAKNKYLSAFQNEVKKLFDEIKAAVKAGANFQAEARKRGMEFNTTEYFPIALKDAVDTNIKDPVQDAQKKPIKLFASTNRSFFETAFKLKKNEVSTMLNSGFTYYMLRLTGTQETGTMDEETYKKYVTSMTKRHQDEIRTRLIRQLYTKYKVKWHEENIIRLVRALQGRSS